MSDKKCAAEKKTEMEGVITQVCLTDAITSFYKLNLVCKYGPYTQRTISIKQNFIYNRWLQYKN